MLNREHLAMFHRDGYLGPLPLAAGRIDEHRLGEIKRLVAEGSPVTGHGTYARHMDSRPIFELCVDPAVLTAVQMIIGHDVLLWNSGFWVKQSGSKPTPWHQDVHYWPTALTVTAWISLTDTDESASCLMVLPGSHRSLLPLVRGTGGALFEYEADTTGLPDEKGLAVPARAGEFVLLHDRVLHRSAAVAAPDAAAALPDRWALAARFTTPFIHVPPDVFPLYPGQHCLLVSGTDRFGINRVGPPPEADPRQPTTGR